MCNDLADARERLLEAQQLRTAEVHLAEAHMTTFQHAKCQRPTVTLRELCSMLQTAVRMLLQGTMHRTTNALSEAVGDIVEAEVPQSMLRQIGEQE